MGIYHTKKQTENIPHSCSYLLLKTLFYFISQCTSVPYLDIGLCKLDKEPVNCNLHLFSQEADLLINVIMKCVNIKLWDILGCFHYILNPPRILERISTKTGSPDSQSSIAPAVPPMCHSVKNRSFPKVFLKL